MKAPSLLVALGLSLAACADDIPTRTSPTPAPGDTSTSAVLVGAGDIAGCSSSYQDEATAKLLDGIPGTVFTACDNAYAAGTVADFQCYDASWGRHKLRTRPGPGIHEYGSTAAAGYFAYFGPQAGPPGLGYYSYDLGAWHIVVLNSDRDLSTQGT